MITWSCPSGTGHKLADGSRDFLGARADWITNAGYWPYGVWGRDHAESWEASMLRTCWASKQSKRTSRVRGRTGKYQVHDMNAPALRDTQFVGRLSSFRCRHMVVLDHSQDSVAQTTTTGGLLSRPGGDEQGQGRSELPRNSPSFWYSFSGSNSVGTELVVGREAPFAGWLCWIEPRL